MGIVTVTANGLGFPDRVPVGPVCLGAYHRVALVTEFRLGGAFQDRIGRVYCMTADACQVLAFVGTRTPVRQ